MVRVAYFSWVHMYGFGGLTIEEATRIPCLHHGPIALLNHCTSLRDAAQSHGFMDDLIKSIEPSILIMRATSTALSHSEKMVDDKLSACIHLLKTQTEMIGLHWYASPPIPLLESLDASLVRQDMQFGDSRTSTASHALHTLLAYGAVSEHIQYVQSSRNQLMQLTGTI